METLGMTHVDVRTYTVWQRNAMGDGLIDIIRAAHLPASMPPCQVVVPTLLPVSHTAVE